MYNIGLPSNKSLFQLYAERIVRLQQLAAEQTLSQKAVVIPLFIMTSPINHTTTQAHFVSNHFFGLDAAHVHFFAQGTLPALTPEGKIIMQSGWEVSEAPDGNGGIYHSLELSGALSALESRYLSRSVHVFSVDNAICKVADPIFLGYCLSREAEVGNKVVWKRHSGERVGVVARKGGRAAIVEYSELSPELAQAQSPDGKLCFGAGNICNHYFTVQFLRKVATAYKEQPAVLPYHVAVKKVPLADDAGRMTSPSEPNGYKLEAFIFDSFPLATVSAILEVPREAEFSPVKNEPGNASDSPDTARKMIMDLHADWAEAAGGRFATDSRAVEISPLVSYGGEGLGEIVKNKDFEESEYLC
jgi:UDP-N-acetylglucosamine/UDP-N-acetylgalactosamine diphosphorylase